MQAFVLAIRALTAAGSTFIACHVLRRPSETAIRSPQNDRVVASELGGMFEYVCMYVCISGTGGGSFWWRA